MIYNALRQNEKENLQDYYSRTMRSIATQVSIGYKPDADINQAIDFTYKLDRKLWIGSRYQRSGNTRWH